MNKDVDNKKYIYKKKPIYDFVKRLFDLSLSLIILLCFFWIYLIIAFFIKISDKGPVFYRQVRIGRYGKEFRIFKFRSMKMGADNLEKFLTPEQLEEYKRNFKLENDPRITRIGKFLRRTSFDELPQLFNIIKGDISFVGPRPVLDEETQLYGENRAYMLSAKPGLTGNWAINGRSDTTYEERMLLELHYVEKRSFMFDMYIIFRTIFCVIFGKGAR